MSSKYHQNPIIVQLKEQAQKLGTPLYGAFELTSKCNLDCKMCYIHTAGSQQFKDVSFDALKQIFDAAYDNGMMFALLTGGECLLRKDFCKIYSYLYDKGVIMSINTNAALFTNNIIDFLVSKPPERIQISLYGSSDEAYERVTGKKAFHTVAQSIDMLLEADLPVDIAVTPSIYMYEDFPNILQYIKSRKLPYNIAPFLISPREQTENSGELSFEQRIELLKIQREIKGKPITEKRETAPEAGCHSDCDTSVFGMPCNAGTIRFVIDSKGFMIPCMSIPEIRINALENDFTVCWDYIHGKMAEVKQPPECSDCFYKTSCAHCPIHRYDGLFSGHCNTKLCEFNQMKYKAGL